MKQLHRSNLFGWSEFNEARNIDFHGLLWVRPEGNILVDPVPLSEHDQNHLQELGGAMWIVITNSDHIRDAVAISKKTGALIAGPLAESKQFPIDCDRWLAENDELVPGLKVFEMQGSKSPGELALLIDERTLVTGDLVRAHQAGELCILPEAKLCDRHAAVASVKRLQQLPLIEAVLTGDGWPVFRNGHKLLSELVSRLENDIR